MVNRIIVKILAGHNTARDLERRASKSFQAVIVKLFLADCLLARELTHTRQQIALKSYPSTPFFRNKTAMQDNCPISKIFPKFQESMLHPASFHTTKDTRTSLSAHRSQL